MGPYKFGMGIKRAGIDKELGDRVDGVMLEENATAPWSDIVGYFFHIIGPLRRGYVMNYIPNKNTIKLSMFVICQH